MKRGISGAQLLERKQTHDGLRRIRANQEIDFFLLGEIVENSEECASLIDSNLEFQSEFK